MYRVLSCVLYCPIDNCVCIDCICCQYKPFIRISSKIIFKKISYNILLGIVIPEVLLNLVYCHGSMQKLNSTVILNFRSCLVNKYLEKGFFIIASKYKQISSIPNDVKLIVHAINQLETYSVMAKNAEISSVANTINKFHIQSNLHLIYKQNLYHVNQD